MKISKLVVRNEGWKVSNSLIVEAEIASDEDDLLDRVCRAVTKWVNTSTDGAKAWEYSGRDFNIGDLASYLHEDELWVCMAEEGIQGFVLRDLPDADKYWYYDTVLVNVMDVERRRS